jgi:hypothetical protein
MESIIDYLRRKLKDAGPSRWEGIADRVNEQLNDPKRALTYHSMRKIAYGEREKLDLDKAELIRDFFLSIERGESELPAAEPAQPV